MILPLAAPTTLYTGESIPFVMPWWGWVLIAGTPLVLFAAFRLLQRDTRPAAVRAADKLAKVQGLDLRTRRVLDKLALAHGMESIAGLLYSPSALNAAIHRAEQVESKSGSLSARDLERLHKWVQQRSSVETSVSVNSAEPAMGPPSAPRRAAATPRRS